MRKTMLLTLTICLAAAAAPARTIVVDINGSGDFTSIQAALNGAVNGDTIKVLPGVYEGAINISKNVTVEGSGYETTTITSNADPTVTISSGKIRWFAVTAPHGTGVVAAGGIVTNNVIRGSQLDGVRIPPNSSAVLSNCVIAGSGSAGVNDYGQTNSAAVYNCISRGNSGNGFQSDWYHLNVSYSDGPSSWTGNNVGMIDSDPKFASASDYHISLDSPCWDTGKPDVYDPDGSRSDMGYFGGPDCPITPVVTNLQLVPQPDGTFIVTATGVANY